MKLWNIIFELKLCAAGGEYRRLLANGGIKVDGEIVKDEDYIVPDGTHVINVGNSKCETVNIVKGMLKVGE